MIFKNKHALNFLIYIEIDVAREELFLPPMASVDFLIYIRIGNTLQLLFLFDPLMAIKKKTLSRWPKVKKTIYFYIVQQPILSHSQRTISDQPANRGLFLHSSLVLD